MAKVIKLKPNSDVIAFLERAQHLVSNMPYWKQGVLEASSLSTNLIARPIIVPFNEQEAQGKSHCQGLKQTSKCSK
jgi:hypothetical protein